MPQTTAEPENLDVVLRSNDTEAICRAAGANRCQRLDVQEGEARSVEIYDDSRT